MAAPDAIAGRPAYSRVASEKHCQKVYDYREKEDGLQEVIAGQYTSKLEGAFHACYH